MREKPGKIKIYATWPGGVEVHFVTPDPNDSLAHIAPGLWYGVAGKDLILNLTQSIYFHPFVRVATIRVSISLE